MTLRKPFEARASILLPETDPVLGLLPDKVFFGESFSNTLYNDLQSSLVASAFGGLDAIPDDLGTSARQSRPKKYSTSSVVRKALSILSRNQPMPKPRADPIRQDTPRIKNVLGELLPLGGVAGEINRASLIGNDCC